MFKLIVAGSRYFKDYERMEKELDYFLSKREKDEIEIVSGGCPTGADAFAERYARSRGLALQVFPANWRRWGKMAGPLRNRHMAEYADALIVYWDGKSSGTANMIKEAEVCGLRIVVRRF
ncbi:MAG: DUF2493 domain-containing protein [Clostridia bacterium]|nr:DUF2493 domain-containing protein [Clostridia bacterium]